MRALRVCNFWWVLPTLLSVVACGGGASTYLQKGVARQTDTVTIKDCNADPDTVIVPKGHTLIWVVDPLESPRHTYTIQFPATKKPIASATAPTGQGQRVIGDTTCTLFGWINKKACMFPYKLVQDGSTTCPDPGVHVGSGGSMVSGGS